MYHRKFTGHGENGTLMGSGSHKCFRAEVLFYLGGGVWIQRQSHDPGCRYTDALQAS